MSLDASNIPSSKLNSAFINILQQQHSLETLYQNLVTALDVADCATKKEAQSLLFTDPISKETYTKLTK